MFFSSHSQIAANAAAASCCCSEPIHCVQQMMRERQRSGSPGRPAAWAPMWSIGPHALSWVNLGTFRSPPAQKNHPCATTGHCDGHTRPSWGPEVGSGPIEADIVWGPRLRDMAFSACSDILLPPKPVPHPPHTSTTTPLTPPQGLQWRRPHLSSWHHSDNGKTRPNFA